MNEKEKTYTLKRLSEIFFSKQSTIITKYSTPAVTLNKDQRLEELKKGRFSIKEVVSGDSSYLSSFIVFDKEKLGSSDQLAIKEDNFKLKCEYDKIRDQVMLGTDEEALKLLKSFTKFGE